MKSLLQFLIVLLLAVPLLMAQDNLKTDDVLPIDSTLVHGVLDNGLQYFIRVNHEPQKRAELRLVVKAGSILEDDDQQGLAHFTEHMAFNGSAHFHKQALVDFLEKSGMRFGADVNAYTSFDKTVYMLQLPTDSLSVFKKGFQVLEDWAHLLSFDPVEIDKERGVVIEEWRGGRGAGARIRDKQFPVLFHGSRYAKRLPIGKKDILESFKPSTLIRFYKEWYRPDLMGVIAVGDFDPEQVRSWIVAHFSKLKNPSDEKPRLYSDVPDHDETLYSIVSDREARFTRVSINTKIPFQLEKTVGDYRQSLVRQLYTSMLNNRLDELLQKANPPYLYAAAGEAEYVHGVRFYSVDVVVKNGGIKAGLGAALKEIERVRRFGFTATELEREKKSALRGMEQVWREKDKQKSAVLAAEYIRHFTDDEPVPGLDYEYAIYRAFIPKISLQEVNAVSKLYSTDKNQVILVSLPQKDGLQPPIEQQLRAIRAAAIKAPLTVYQDVKLDKPVIAPPEGRAAVVTQQSDSLTGTQIWTLANGVRVVLKPTTFKNDEILFLATSPGGLSLAPLKTLQSDDAADDIAGMSGLGRYNAVELQKYLADKVAYVSAYIGARREGLQGSASPKDLETLFQMIYARFRAARLDSSSFLSYIKRMHGVLQNRSSQPASVFNDTLNAILTQHNPRFKTMQESDLDKIKLKEAARFYRERFADGDDFTFFFVGNFIPDSIRPLVEKYLGCLPVVPGREKWKNVTYHFPKGVIHKELHKGLEPKGRSVLVFTGPAVWGLRERMILSSLTDVLRIKLRERLREDKGGTYGVGVYGSLYHYPLQRYKITIDFGADPRRIDELQKTLFAQIDSLRNFGVEASYMQKVRETDLRSFETNRRENRFWLYSLYGAWINSLKMDTILDYPENVKNITAGDIRAAAKKYLNMQNYIRLDLYPEAAKKPADRAD